MDQLLEFVRRLFSFQYDDRPMGDAVYEFHRQWIRWIHDYYLRVRHIGELEACVAAARRERVVLVANHSLTIEALIINYMLHCRGAGHVGTLVFREAFKLPLVREFFRSCQCLPVSVASGAQALLDRHILIFPEGMDFMAGLADPEAMPRFHTGFLRIAQLYLRETKRKSITIVPIAHVGIERMLKFWVIKNEKILNALIRPIAKYPFWVVPKLPLFLPSKVVVNWGKPIKVSLASLANRRKIEAQAERFRATVRRLRIVAEAERERHQRSHGLSLHKIAEFEPPY